MSAYQSHEQSGIQTGEQQQPYSSADQTVLVSKRGGRYGRKRQKRLIEVPEMQKFSPDVSQENQNAKIKLGLQILFKLEILLDDPFLGPVTRPTIENNRILGKQNVID